MVVIFSNNYTSKFCSLVILTVCPAGHETRVGDFGSFYFTICKPIYISYIHILFAGHLRVMIGGFSLRNLFNRSIDCIASLTPNTHCSSRSRPPPQRGILFFGFFWEGFFSCYISQYLCIDCLVTSRFDCSTCKPRWPRF